MSEIIVLASREAASGELIKVIFRLILEQLLDEHVAALLGVRHHERFDKGDIRIPEGLNDIPVLLYRVSHPSGHGERRDPEALELLDQLVDHRAEFLVAAGLEEDVVELVVEFEET